MRYVSRFQFGGNVTDSWLLASVGEKKKSSLGMRFVNEDFWEGGWNFLRDDMDDCWTKWESWWLLVATVVWKHWKKHPWSLTVRSPLKNGWDWKMIWWLPIGLEGNFPGAKCHRTEAISCVIHWAYLNLMPLMGMNLWEYLAEWMAHSWNFFVIHDWWM